MKNLCGNKGHFYKNVYFSARTGKYFYYDQNTIKRKLFQSLSSKFCTRKIPGRKVRLSASAGAADKKGVQAMNKERAKARLTEETIEQFLASLQEKGRSQDSVKTYRQTLTALLDFLLETEQLTVGWNA
jgi:hypothetical protein